MLELILYPTYILIRAVAARMLGFRKETIERQIDNLLLSVTLPPPPGFENLTTAMSLILPYSFIHIIVFS